MTEPTATDPRRGEIELLLPFYATGRISAADRTRVDKALAADPGLAVQLELIREDMAETVLLNESLGAPSPGALEKLMAGIEAEPQGAPMLARARGGVMHWLAGLLAAQPPRRLAYACAAALALIVLQGVALTGFVVNRGGGFETASKTAQPDASHVLLGFAPEAKASEIAGFLRRFEAVIVDGPRANGFYRLRLGGAKLGAAELDAVVARMRAESTIVAFAAPAS